MGFIQPHRVAPKGKLSVVLPVASSGSVTPSWWRPLEDRVCQAYRHGRSLFGGLLNSREYPLTTSTSLAPQMPFKSREESISSFERARFARRSIRYPLIWLPAVK